MPGRTLTGSRRHLLFGLGGSFVITPKSALACAEADHPCGPTGAAIVPKEGPAADLGNECEAGIKAIVTYLRKFYPNLYGDLEVVFIETTGDSIADFKEAERALKQRNRPGALIVLDFYLSPEQLAQLSKDYATPCITILGEPDLASHGQVFSVAPSADQMASDTVSYLKTLNLGVNAKVALISAAWSSWAERQQRLEGAIRQAGFDVQTSVVTAQAGGAAATIASERVKNEDPKLWLLSLPSPLAIAAADEIVARSTRPVLIDAWLGDPETILRSIGQSNVAVITSFAPHQEAKNQLARQVSDIFQSEIGKPLTAAGALAATAAQVLAKAATLMPVHQHGEGPATQKALLRVNIPGSELLVPWRGVWFDKGTLQNMGADVVVVSWDGDRTKMVWPKRRGVAGGDA